MCTCACCTCSGIEWRDSGDSSHWSWMGSTLPSLLWSLREEGEAMYVCLCNETIIMLYTGPTMKDTFQMGIPFKWGDIFRSQVRGGHNNYYHHPLKENTSITRTIYVVPMSLFGGFQCIIIIYHAYACSYRLDWLCSLSETMRGYYTLSSMQATVCDL